MEFRGADMSRLRRNQRAGVLLDAVLSLAFVIVGAFVLESVGLSLGELLRGAMRFFGI